MLGQEASFRAGDVATCSVLFIHHRAAEEENREHYHTNRNDYLLKIRPELALAWGRSEAKGRITDG